MIDPQGPSYTKVSWLMGCVFYGASSADLPSFPVVVCFLAGYSQLQLRDSGGLGTKVP